MITLLRLRKLRYLIFRTLLGDRLINWAGRGQIGLVDVGAAGFPPEPWLNHPGAIRALLSFEPRQRSSQSNRVRSVDAALWSRRERRPFYIFRGLRGQGSSLLVPDLEWVRQNWAWLSKLGPRELAESYFARNEVVETRSVECRTLDDVLDEVGGTYHFLKVDAQGAELEILKGAQRFLSTQCVGLQLELMVYPLVQGAATMDEVTAFLADLGFDLVLKLPPHGSFDSQHDCVYLHRGRSGPVMRLLRSLFKLD